MAAGAVYAEIRFAPELHAPLDPREGVEAVTAGFRRGEVEADGRITANVLDRRIHLELAPTCNVQIGAVPSVAEHPIGPFLRAGFSVEDAFAPYEVRRRIVDDVVRPAYAALAAP